MTELATAFTFIARCAPSSGRVVARKLDRSHHVHSRSQHAGAGAPPALWTHRRCIVLAASADDPRRRAARRHRHHCGARLRLRLQRVRCRRAQYAARTGSRRPSLFRILDGEPEQNLGRKLQRARRRSTATRTSRHSWYNVGFEYIFNRDWGVMVRIPVVDRNFTTETDVPALGDTSTFNAQGIGDIEVMGIYTGFFPDMSTGVIFGLKLPTGPYTASGARPRHPDRLGLDRPAARRLPPRHAHRRQCLAVLLAGALAAAVPLQLRRRSAGLLRRQCRRRAKLYKPGYQVDGAIGIVYNNLYNVLGFDKITPLGAGHRLASRRRHWHRRRSVQLGLRPDNAVARHRVHQGAGRGQ